MPNIVAGLVEYGEVESLYENLSEGQRGGAMGELLVIKRNIGRTCGGEVGGSALDFALEEAHGGVVRLSECYARGFVLLDFWASWCRPCIGEIPRVKELNERLDDELQILSVSVDQDDAQWREASNNTISMRGHSLGLVALMLPIATTFVSRLTCRWHTASRRFHALCLWIRMA